MSSRNVELARRGYEAACRGDLAVMGELLAEDVIWHGGDPDAEGACHGRGQALAFMARWERGGPGRLVEIVDAGDRVVVIVEVPARDGEPAHERAQVSTFTDGKVIEMVAYPTVASALAAAGVQGARARPAS
jgi:ketosteroid isomerase-like protein